MWNMKVLSLEGQGHKVKNYGMIWKAYLLSFINDDQG